MRISSARFVKSARQPDDFPHDKRPEVAFCGRSNIGKSSLLNALTDSRGLARTSSTPGRTQTINFFLVNEKIYFVDLPGYGYARVSKTTRDSLGQMIESYLTGSKQLKLALMLVDCRIPPTESDRLMKEWLDHLGIPNAVVLTKADKLSKTQLSKQLKVTAEYLGSRELVPYSSETGLGRDKVWAEIQKAVYPSS